MRKLAVLLLLTGSMYCTAPVRNYLEPQDRAVSDTLTQIKGTTVSVEKPLPQSQSPNILSVQNWPGNRFVLLDKQKLFSQHGYELYTCRQLDSCTSQADTVWTRPNHRLRYDKFKGHVLRVTDVEQISDEWLVTFIDENTNMVIYARTHKGAIKEIALENDLEMARKRWMGKYVFSRKGVISTILENGSGFSSMKVRIQDSLKVIDVRWGTSPLPVNPIWLIVEASGNRKGFIPVRYSWTNTLSDQIRNIDAWGNDILENDPSVEHSWSPEMWELINNHRIVVEMTREQVFLSWGEPLSRVRKENKGIQRECWIYSSQELYFDEKGLADIVDIQ